MRCAVLCFGNELHGDDGFGIAVGQQLAQHPLPPPWELHLVGTRGLDALALLQGCRQAVLVDAQMTDGVPGRLHWRDAVATREALEAPAASVHTAGIDALLGSLRCLEAAASGSGTQARASGAASRPEAGEAGQAMPSRNAQVSLLTVEMDQCRPFHMALSSTVAGSVETAVAALLAFMHSGQAPAHGPAWAQLFPRGEVDVTTA